MKKITFLFLIYFLIFNYSRAQNLEKYSEYVKEAWDLYENKKFKESAEKYKEAFDQVDGKAYQPDRYNAACSYALANDAENSFYHLFYLAEKISVKYNDLNHLLNDSDLKFLHSDKGWNELIEIVKKNKDEFEKNFDRDLIIILDSIYADDQNYRIQLNEIEEKFGKNSPEVKKHWETINEKDSINLIKVKKILDERGWIGPDVIGEKGSSILFLVIQHSDIESQKKYLPMMRDAVVKGKANPSSLALLEDRVALRMGEKQIYGSQIGWDEKTEKYYILPLIDPDNVDKRRTEVGLGPIQEYISNWNMTWNVEEYKKNISELENIRK